MKSKFQQNGIVTGYINSYCLVCESHLDSEAVASWHINQYEHEKNLGLFPYLEKYKYDNIRKLRNCYFCEHCNKILTTIANLNLHVAEGDHIENKVYNSFQRDNGFVKVFDKIVIEENAWHSLADKTCAICSMEFENENIHKSDASHIIKLVQSKVNMHGDAVYRMMSDDTFQCLTCNVLCAYSDIDGHIKSLDHLRLYRECEVEYDQKYGAFRSPAEQEKRMKGMVEQFFFGAVSEPNTDEAELELLEYIPIDVPTKCDPALYMYLRSDNGETDNALPHEERRKKTKAIACHTKIFHDFESASNQFIRQKRNSADIISDKKQDEDPSVLMTRNADERQKSEMEAFYKAARRIKTITNITHQSFLNTPEEYALQNYMVMAKRRAAHVYCKLCTTKIEFSMEEMRNHVNTRKHWTLVVHAAHHDVTRASPLAFTIRDFVPFRMAMIDFIFDSRYVRNRLDVLVNKTFCITTDSFNLLYNVHNTQLLCHVCPHKEPFVDSDRHLDKAIHHVLSMNLSLVLIEFKEEFIREISKNKFHCGFCNIVLPSLRDLQDHMKGDNHKRNKISAYKRLNQHFPAQGQAAAISAIIAGQEFTPNWTGRPTPGTY